MFINKNQKNFRANYGDYLPLWAKVSFNQLALYGVHIGHSIDNLTPYSSWMVLGSRQGLCLINMFKFMYMFRGGLFIIQALIRKRSPIWFINLDQSSQSIIQSAAKECGEYWINENWINGLLTNFHRITKAARHTIKTPRIMWTSRQHNLTQNFRHWSLSRYTWPRAVFVSNVSLSYNVCQEAMNLRIPTIGIVDTDSPQKYVNMAVPGNDESFSSVGFYNNLISMFILYNKFTMVNLWYINKLSYIKNNLDTNVKNKISKINNYHIHVVPKNVVNLNEFVFTSPVSNIKFGTLNHYQDVWKTRGIQLMYDLSISNKVHHKALLSSINPFYTKNQLWLYTLKNIYKYSKKWTGVFKIPRKNRRFKVKLGIKKKIKLHKNAWYFLQRGRISNSRLFRTQTFNFWKLKTNSVDSHSFQNITQIYKRYFKKVYWFPKSKIYNHMRLNIHNLLSTWFFIQFSCKRILFSNFFHNFTHNLTNSIKQKRMQLKKAQGIEMRNKIKQNYINKNNDLSIEQEVESSYLANPLSNLSKNGWYLKVMGLRHSIKKNTFLTGKLYKPLILSDVLIDVNGHDSASIYNHIICNKSNYNYGIKYLYNEWVTNSIGGKINISNLNNNYYNSNMALFKPQAQACNVYINTFIGTRFYYIK